MTVCGGQTSHYINSEIGGSTVVASDIKRVYHLKGRWSRRSTAKIGAVIGTLVGTFLGVRRTIEAEARPGHVPSDADTAPAFAGLAIGGLTGAGIGALIGGKRRARLLYDEK